VVEDDQRLLLRAIAAARQALGAGITTVRDLGGRGGVTFRVRDGNTAGLIVGTLAVGRAADLIAVDGDPSMRIGDLRAVQLVMKSGAVVARNG
jgi:imidazolonepropionase-like amidohydrolase